MKLFTRHFRMTAIKNNRFARYLLYAVGEIVLVVAGILIALQINNHNEARKEAAKLQSVIKNVSYDLELDTLMVNNAIEFYTIREKIATDIIEEKYSPEDFKTCLICGSIVSTYFPLKINDKGYTQLRNFYESTNNRDTLTVEIVQFYNAYGALLDEFGAQVKDFTLDNIKDWRDNQPWFSTVISGAADPRFTEYMTTQEFKNKVAYFNAIACKNYLLMLKQYKAQASELLNRIAARKKVSG